MRNVVPARALVRRSRNLLLASVVLVLFGVLASTMSVFMRAVPLVSPATPNYGFYVSTYNILIVVGALLIIFGFGLALRAITWRQDNTLAEAIGNALDEFLDDRFIFIRNVSKLPIGYVDGVLIGPPGVLVFRITRRGGTFFNEGARWMQQKDKGNWVPLRWSPTKECVDDIKKLREFLQARNLAEVPVFGAVVFTEAEPATKITTEQPVVPVLQPHELSYKLDRDYFAKDRINQIEANQVAKLLYQ